jgi:3-oxoacyl-[acyl-carrier protein] reductase
MTLVQQSILQQFTTIIFIHPTTNIQQIFLGLNCMNLSLKGRTAIVCGSTQGIGLASAVELSKQGATCVLMARNETSLKEALQHLSTSENQHHSYLVADFDEPETVRSVIEAFVDKNAVHILINNSGGPASGLITEAKDEDFINTFNRHLICNHILTKVVVPSMKKEGYGRIINIISTSVKIPLPNLGVSNTIRGAVASWSKTMANELGQFNITVNNVLPGATKTQRLESIISNNAGKKNIAVADVEREMMKEIPMKRFAEPEELANVVAFLASPAASYVNGVSIPVDGGRTGSL